MNPIYCLVLIAMSTKTAANDVHLSDDRLLMKAQQAENGDRFRRRFTNPYEGTILEKMYETRWQAEVALLTNLAFWSGKNREQMLRLYKRSALYQEQPEKFSKFPEYKRALIKKAMSLCGDGYDPDYYQNKI